MHSLSSSLYLSLFCSGVYEGLLVWNMPESRISVFDASVLPSSAVEETRQLLSERDATKVVLGTMLAQLEECSHQADTLESLYGGLITSPEGLKHKALQNAADIQDDSAAMELAGLHALIEQKQRQLHELKHSWQGLHTCALHSDLNAKHTGNMSVYSWSLACQQLLSYMWYGHTCHLTNLRNG